MCENDLFQSISTQLTSSQNESLQRLITIRQQQIQYWGELLMFEMRILYKFLPLNFNQLENVIAPISSLSLNNGQKTIQFNNKQNKIIQEGKRRWLDVYLNSYEIKLQEYDEQYQTEFEQFKQLQILNNTTTIVDPLPISIDKIKEYMVYRTNSLKQDIYQQISSFRERLLHNRQRSSTTKTTIGVSPEPYLDLHKNPFNTCQWTQLSLGPSFIRMNQSALRPQHQQKVAIETEYKDISEKVKKHLTFSPHSVPLTSPYFQQYSRQLRTYLNQCYSSPTSYKNQIQALQQKHIAQTIRETIKKHKLIIRQTDKGHNFYIGSQIEFEKTVQKFFQDTNAFMELSYNPFNEIQNKIITLLNQLRKDECISKEQYNKMIFNRTTSELAHLYFNPKTHKEYIQVRPIEHTIHAPTTKISQFLDQLIRPIFNEKCDETNLIDSNSFLKKMIKYYKKGLLKPSTLFCTFDIRNLYTMLPQEETLNILVEFLHVHGYNDVQGIALDTIRKLASLVIKENVFVYDKKIYHQTTGGAMGSSFTLTLANIFMWKWQKQFVRQQDITSEFFGRYIDDIFITWNGTEKELIKFLNEANTWHPNIKLDYKIGQSLPFLDILLTNNNGTISTSVYHKPAAEPYVVPFISDHPRHIFINIIQTRLANALKCSSTFEIFNYERRHIKLMLLYNGYPSSFIETQYRKFFNEYIYSTSFLPFIIDEEQFFLMRNKLFSQFIYESSHVSEDNALINTVNIRTAQVPQNTTTEINVEHNTTTITTPKRNNTLFLHYTYEQRFKPMKRGGLLRISSCVALRRFRLPTIILTF
ncbi:unnamed protein product [Adineta steineri]|uniref:Reverse transcriptase domain-containing protein n=1 Tax=Adineta steineri TaxID=433720 RepID=A0A815UTX9_9BILA|nr:unnamed protein product [Adineta steineri]CAF4191328.1 unnamed protein product [Adineta steineri]